MTNVCSDKCRVRIRYDGWGSEWDDWVTAPWTEHLARRGRGPHRNQDGTARERHKMQALCRVQQLYFGMGRLQRRTSMSCTPDTMFSSVDQLETTKQRLIRASLSLQVCLDTPKSLAQKTVTKLLWQFFLLKMKLMLTGLVVDGKCCCAAQVSAVLGCIVRAVVRTLQLLLKFNEGEERISREVKYWLGENVDLLHIRRFKFMC